MEEFYTEKNKSKTNQWHEEIKNLLEFVVQPFVERLEAQSERDDFLV